MRAMLEGVIALAVSYRVTAFTQPLIDRLSANCIERGYQLADYQDTFLLLEFTAQVAAYLLVFGALELLSFLYRRWRDGY